MDTAQQRDSGEVLEGEVGQLLFLPSRGGSCSSCPVHLGPALNPPLHSPPPPPPLPLLLTWGSLSGTRDCLTTW